MSPNRKAKTIARIVNADDYWPTLTWPWAIPICEPKRIHIRIQASLLRLKVLVVCLNFGKVESSLSSSRIHPDYYAYAPISTLDRDSLTVIDDGTPYKYTPTQICTHSRALSVDGKLSYNLWTTHDAHTYTYRNGRFCLRPYTCEDICASQLQLCSRDIWHSAFCSAFSHRLFLAPRLETFSSTFVYFSNYRCS